MRRLTDPQYFVYYRRKMIIANINRGNNGNNTTPKQVAARLFERTNKAQALPKSISGPQIIPNGRRQR